MIDPDEIEETIDKFLSTRDTSFYACSRLADMYTVLDHLRPKGGNAAVTDELHGSEFLEACSGVPYKALMEVLDEHMETIHTLYPKTYSALVERIRQL